VGKRRGLRDGLAPCAPFSRLRASREKQSYTIAPRRAGDEGTGVSCRAIAASSQTPLPSPQPLSRIRERGYRASRTPGKEVGIVRRTNLQALCPARSGQPITRSCRVDRERSSLSRFQPHAPVLDPTEDSVGSVEARGWLALRVTLLDCGMMSPLAPKAHPLMRLRPVHPGIGFDHQRHA
jgi:hypothetical protein